LSRRKLVGLFTVNIKEIEKDILNEFGDLDNHVIAFKHNTVAKSITKTILSTLYRNVDSSREFILYFSENGVYEKEFGFSENSKYILIPWNEIEEFNKKDEGDKVIIKIKHLGKSYDYEIPFDGKIMMGNRERVSKLIENNFYIENKDILSD